MLCKSWTSIAAPDPRIHKVSAVCSLLSIAVVCANASAANDDVDWPGAMSRAELREQGFKLLGSERSLEAWDVKPWHEGHWTIRDGIIDYDGQAEGEHARDNTLWSKEAYGDFELYVEWRLSMEPRMKPHPIVLWNGDFLLNENGKRITRPRLDAGDSGIYVRGSSKSQINIWSQEQGSGEITGYRTDRSLPQKVRRGVIPLKNADRPFGEWNAFLITVQGSEIKVELNGETVIETVALPGLPESGPLALQHHGRDPIQFRKIWIKRLK